MSKVKKKLSMLEQFYYTVLPDKQEFFKSEFMRLNKCSESTFYRRLRTGKSLDDLALFQYIFKVEIFKNAELINSIFTNKNVNRYSPELVNQLNIF